MGSLLAQTHYWQREKSSDQAAWQVFDDNIQNAISYICKDVFKDVFKDVMIDVFIKVIQNVCTYVFEYVIKDVFRNVLENLFNDVLDYVFQDTFKEFPKHVFDTSLKESWIACLKPALWGRLSWRDQTTSYIASLNALNAEDEKFIYYFNNRDKYVDV